MTYGELLSLYRLPTHGVIASPSKAQIGAQLCERHGWPVESFISMDITADALKPLAAQKIEEASSETLLMHIEAVQYAYLWREPPYNIVWDTKQIESYDCGQFLSYACFQNRPAVLEALADVWKWASEAQDGMVHSTEH